ncbi:hypothetical protein ABW20_dc0107794 [Dactylellina cionopaga]|nr:hypothetical protein ABW20_dc0107794 [Dactylellina cionopaga]
MSVPQELERPPGKRSSITRNGWKRNPFKYNARGVSIQVPLEEPSGQNFVSSSLHDQSLYNSKFIASQHKPYKTSEELIPPLVLGSRYKTREGPIPLPMWMPYQEYQDPIPLPVSRTYETCEDLMPLPISRSRYKIGEGPRLSSVALSAKTRRFLRRFTGSPPSPPSPSPPPPPEHEYKSGYLSLKKPSYELALRDYSKPREALQIPNSLAIPSKSPPESLKSVIEDAEVEPRRSSTAAESSRLPTVYTETVYTETAALEENVLPKQNLTMPLDAGKLIDLPNQAEEKLHNNMEDPKPVPTGIEVVKQSNTFEGAGGEVDKSHRSTQQVRGVENAPPPLELGPFELSGYHKYERYESPALHSAISKGNLSAICDLLENGADIFKKGTYIDGAQLSAIEFAVRCEHKDILSYFLAHDINCYGPAILETLRCGNDELHEYIFKRYKECKLHLERLGIVPREFKYPRDSLHKIETAHTRPLLPNIEASAADTKISAITNTATSSKSDTDYRPSPNELTIKTNFGRSTIPTNPVDSNVDEDEETSAKLKAAHLLLLLLVLSDNSSSELQSAEINSHPIDTSEGSPECCDADEGYVSRRPSDTGGSSRGEGTSEKRSRKRPHVERDQRGGGGGGGGDDDGGDDFNRPPPKKQTISGIKDVMNKLACPYAKAKPKEYQACQLIHRQNLSGIK